MRITIRFWLTLINQESDITSMLNSVPLEEIAPIIIGVSTLVQAGIAITAFGHVGNNVIRTLDRWFDLEPIHPEEPELLFERVFDSLFSPLGAKVGAYTRSPRTTKLALELSLGVIVVISAITFEVVGILTVTGAAFAKYHLTGASFDLTPAYQSVVSVVVFLTLVFMSYGNRKIDEKTKYR